MKLEYIRQTQLDTPFGHGLAAQVAVYEVARGDLPGPWFVQYGVTRLVHEIRRELGAIHLDAVVVAQERVQQLVQEALTSYLGGDELALRRFEGLRSEKSWKSPEVGMPRERESLHRAQHRESLGEAAAVQLTRVVNPDMLLRLALHAMMKQIHYFEPTGSKLDGAIADLTARIRDEVSEVLNRLRDADEVWEMPDPEDSGFSELAGQTIQFTVDR